MTTAQMNTLGDLVTAMTQAEVSLTQAQQKVGEAQDFRDSRRKAYMDFLASIQVSDAAPVPTRKRQYIRKAKALLDSAPNAATMFNDEGRQS